MKSNLYLAEVEVIKNLKLLSEQDDDEYTKISPEEVYKLLDAAGNIGAVLRHPKFKGKKLYVTGNLNVSNRKELEHLGNIGYVDGDLNISRTNIEDISQITVKGRTWDSSTPIERRRLRKELLEKKAINDERRQSKEWDVNNPNIDELGLKANALYQYFIDNGDVSEQSEDEKEEYNLVKSQIEELNKKYDESEEPEEYNKIYDEISSLEDKLEELGPKFDVYDLYPLKWSFYGLSTFEVLHEDHKNEEYTVGDSDEMEDAALEYSENLIDDVGLDGFRPGFIDDYLDEDAIRSLFEEDYNEYVRENPDSYFDKSDYQLTDEQEKRIEQLQTYIEELEEFIKEKENEQNELENEIEDPQEYEKAYDEVQKLIDEAEKNKETAQDELDGIEPDNEPTEEMIENKVTEIVDEMMEDPIRSLKNRGADIKYYIDEKALAKGLVDSDGWEVMNGYDGRYESIDVKNETFYVMRVS